MKAIVVRAHGGPEQLDWTEVPTPTPQADELLLRMTATSVNFADIKGRRAPYRHFQAPYVPGFDGVGIVEACGPDVTTLQTGQRVAAYVKGGSYAEYALAKEVLCYPMPDDVSDADGTGIGVLITAYNALVWAARLQPQERVLIHAASGGVGSCALQIARHLDASIRFATVGHARKETLCRELGATEVYNHQNNFAQEILDATDGQGVDVILDTIGGTTFEKSMKCLATFGRLVIFGHSSGEAGHFSSKPLHRENRAVIGYSSGGYRKHQPHLLQPTAQTVLQLLQDKHVHIHQGAQFPLAQAADAHQLFEERQNIGKIILLP